MIDAGRQTTGGKADAMWAGSKQLYSGSNTYIFALVVVAFGWVLRLALEAWVGEGLPVFITFYPAVMIVSLLGGWGPGLLATGLVALSVAFGLMSPQGFVVSRPIDVVSLLLFLVMSLLTIVVTEKYRQSRAKAAAYDHDAATRAIRCAAEQTLQQSEERYRLLVEQVVDGIFVSDAQGRYLDVNTAGAKMLGYSREEILARRIADLVSPEERLRLPQEINHFANGAVVTSQWRFQRKNGSTFFGEVVGRQLPDGRLLGILRDISVSRQFEMERMQERALLNAVAANTDVLLVYLDSHFNFVWVNQAYVNTCQVTRECLIGKNHFALYPNSENEATFCRVRDTGETVFYKDKPFQFPDQPERGITYWDWSLAPDKDALGRVIGLVFSLRETTQYVRAQLAVRESNERFTALANAAPVFIWISGPDKVCSWFNQQWLNFTGRTLAQELDNGWIEGVHPDDIGHCLGTYNSSFDRRESFKMDYRQRAASGEYRWLSDQASPHYSPDGEFLGYIGTCIDITERKKAENAVKAAQASAEQANNAKSRFLAAASHDLRQPLSALGIYVGVLKMNAGARDAPVLASMADCVNSLSELLTDLLDISKLEAGVVIPEVSQFPVADLLTRQLAVHAPEAMEKGLRLRSVTSRLYARTDPVIYQRIVGNLISNAIRYTDQGGVLVGCRRRQGKYWIEVWDSGIGIPEDKTSEIFEEFRQLEHDERNRGSGLGLAIAAKSATLLGLEIRLCSRLGKGSMFALELPLGEQTESVLAQEQGMRPLHIALVDDNSHVLHAMVSVLESMGHHVTAASSGLELFEQLGNQPPDIVVSDFRLGKGESGFDVIEDARALFGDNLPALLITGDTDPKLIRSMADRGIVVQHKPFKSETLQASLAKVVNSRTA